MIEFVLAAIILLAALGGIIYGTYKFVAWYRFNIILRDVREWVLSYKKRCTGNNRFIVTKETLQDSFFEYDSDVIDRIWLELTRERVIEQDPMDNEWCIK